MSQRRTLMAGAVSLGLVLAIGASAHAQPSGKGGNYGPPPAAVRPKSPRTPCDCPMMKGDAAMRDHCMSKMDHEGQSTAKPEVPHG